MAGTRTAEVLGQSRSLYLTPEWKALRRQALARDGGMCVRCGATERLQVDHIRPRSTHPHLALDLDNTQVLCIHCNSHKGTRTGPTRTTWLNPSYH